MRAREGARWLGTATALLVAGLWLDMAIERPPDLSPTAASAAVDDPKLARTAQESLALAKEHHDPARLVAVDRPGMSFHFEMDRAAQRGYRDSRGSTPEENPWVDRWVDTRLSIEDGPPLHALIRVRGNMSTQAERKSLNTLLSASQTFREGVLLRRLFLINLFRDPNGHENHFAYRLLGRLGLFPSYHQRATVGFNGDLQGLYLAVERPEDGIRRRHPETLAVLRLRNRRFEVEYEAANFDHEQALRAIHNAQRARDDADQLKRYEDILELDQFMRWLGVNSLLENVDTRDELFLYALPTAETGFRLHPVGWDYEDLQPNERRSKYVHPLTSGEENLIGERLLQNPLLLSRYRAVLRRLLEDELTPELLMAELEDVSRDVTSILGASKMRDKVVHEFGARLLARRRALLDELDGG